MYTIQVVPLSRSASMGLDRRCDAIHRTQPQVSRPISELEAEVDLRYSYEAADHSNNARYRF